MRECLPLTDTQHLVAGNQFCCFLSPATENCWKCFLKLGTNSFLSLFLLRAHGESSQVNEFRFLCHYELNLETEFPPTRFSACEKRSRSIWARFAPLFLRDQYPKAQRGKVPSSPAPKTSVWTVKCRTHNSLMHRIDPAWTWLEMNFSRPPPLFQTSFIFTRKTFVSQPWCLLPLQSSVLGIFFNLLNGFENCQMQENLNLM